MAQPLCQHRNNLLIKGLANIFVVKCSKTDGAYTVADKKQISLRSKKVFTIIPIIFI